MSQNAYENLIDLMFISCNITSDRSTRKKLIFKFMKIASFPIEEKREINNNKNHVNNLGGYVGKIDSQ